ncbi:MAG: NAD(P)/FAD-dependent oxidoreductase [Nitrospinota bacterium]|nr:MAG: NAD(P)/FAD-dependent oxidoreductase [Nitrospinota bacterium]
MAQRFDVIVIGGGHNGLVTAGYLARAGLQVLVLERRPVVGGACVTEEPWPGYKVSTLAYLCSLLQPRIIQELELEKFGYHLYPKDPAFFTAFPDGRYLFFWQEMRKTVEELKKFSPHDAAVYPEYEAQLARLAEFVESILLMTPPNVVAPRPADLLSLVRLGIRLWGLGKEDMAAFLKIMTQSARQFLDDRFTSDEIKTTLATDGVIGTNGGPSTPGTAYVLLHHCMGGATGQRGLWGFVRGGMGAIAQALARSAEAHGAKIRTNAAVQQITVRGEQATGVVLEDGEELAARVVISNLDPKRTFLQLIAPEHLPEDFRRDIARFRIEGCSLKVNLALDTLPEFTAYPSQRLAPPHRATIHICPSLEYIDRAWHDAELGRPSEHPMIEITIPTAYDDSLAPPGKHIMSLFIQYAPYTLKDTDWDTIKEAFADRCIDLIAEYAPNIKSAILHRQVISPLDMEREYGLTGGNIFHGDLSLDQLFFARPLLGWAQYRTPIRHLYLCGSGTHPGGGVMGIPGYNAAQEVWKDWRKGI